MFTSNAMIRACLALACICFFVSCQEANPQQALQPTPSKPLKQEAIALEKEPTEQLVPLEQSTEKSALFAGRLESFYSTEDYYVPLYFKEELADKEKMALYQRPYASLYVHEEEKRSAIEAQVAEEYFLTHGLQQLVVLNAAQQIVDTITLKGYEYLESLISSSFVATYASSSTYKEAQVISLEALLESSPKSNAPALLKNEKAFNNILSANDLRTDDTHFQGSFQWNDDEYVLASFSNEQNHSTSVYLFKNGQTVDSLQKDFYLADLQPLPLGNKDRSFYTAQAGIPETDALWNQLLEINWKEGTLTAHESNRFYPL